VLNGLRTFRYQLVEWLKLHRRIILLVLWFIFALASGGAYAFFAQYFSLPVVNPTGVLQDGSLVLLSSAKTKDQPHPISGIFYSSEESSAWAGHRPLAVMIDNHALARPHQFGLQKADVIYEAVAEGGITRFLAVFHSQEVEKLGPVRSSRVYYIDWALEFPAYYAHVGGASKPGPADINAYITKNKVLSLNQFRLGAATYTYGGDVMLGGTILSHINYTSTAKLWEAGERLYPGTNFLPEFAIWKFKAEVPFGERPESQEISFDFDGLPLYAGRWVYDKKNNYYLRFQGGTPHIDQATGKQLFAKNVALVSMIQRSAGDGTNHRLYTTTGQGDAVLYFDGKETLATWKRSSLSSRMLFYERGTDKEVEFNRGLTWIEIIPK